MSGNGNINILVLKNAALISIVIAIVSYVLTFLSTYDAVSIANEPVLFIIESIKNLVIAWASSFATLSGISLIKLSGQTSGESTLGNGVPGKTAKTNHFADCVKAGPIKQITCMVVGRRMIANARQ